MNCCTEPTEYEKDFEYTIDLNLTPIEESRDILIEQDQLQNSLGMPDVPQNLRTKTIRSNDEICDIMDGEVYQKLVSEGFRNMNGVVDCTHIPIKSPSIQREADYLNRKHFHA
ncbi:UNVERIFIED_CONTAM: hypothetical protein FKN15_043413 [Acipenser sinensis]